MLNGTRFNGANIIKYRTKLYAKQKKSIIPVLPVFYSR